MRIEFSKEAQKVLSKLSAIDQKKIVKAIGKINQDPIAGEKLKGEFKGLFKLRAWPYRVIYSFNSGSKIVFIVTIGHRQGV